MKIEKRENESAAIIHRNKMEELPPNVDENKWNEFRRLYNNAANLYENLIPAQLDIEINSDCNLKCSFCINSLKDNEHIFLSFDKYKNIIDQAVAIGVHSIKLNYMNEPLLVNNIDEYIDYAIKKGIINVFFSTNGILLNNEMSLKLINSGLTKIFISIDATNSEIYKEQRNSNKYEIVKNNVLNFIKIRNSLKLEYPLVRVNFLENNINKHQKNDFISYWEDKADIVIIQEMNELIDNKTNLYIEKEKKDYHCSFPFKQLVVTSKGDILPCCTMYGIRHKIGNVENMKLIDAWNSELIKSLRKLHKKGNYTENKHCKHCVLGI